MFKLFVNSDPESPYTKLATYCFQNIPVVAFPESESCAHIILSVIVAHRQAVSRRLVGLAVGGHREDRRGECIWQGQMVDCPGDGVQPGTCSGPAGPRGLLLE